MNAGRLLRILDYFFVTRPLLLLPAWSFYPLGAAEAAGPGGHSPWQVPSPSAFLSLSSLLVCGYLVNQIFDRESDRRNRKVFFLSEGIVGVRSAVALALAFFLLGSLFFHRSPAPLRPYLAVAAALALVYSLPPFRLCSRPLLDMAANAVGYGGIAFLLGYRSRLQGGEPWLLSLPYVLLVASVFLLTTLLDYEGDRDTGKHSTAVALGTAPTLLLARLLAVGALVAALARENYFAAAVVAVALPFPFYARQREARRLSLAVQASTMVVILAAGSRWPWYLLLAGALVALARSYYHRRFRLVYPGVAGPKR